MIRVAIAGAMGRMGRVATAAMKTATGITYAGGFARAADPGERIFDNLHALLVQERPDVLLDLTTQPSSFDISLEAVTHGVRPVVGATGWQPHERDALEGALRERGIGGMIVPNFSLGAILMMEFAAKAAPLFESVEIIELHHNQKKDAPSGTARLTAQRVAENGGRADVPIHSVRMKGLVAHQEVLFGNEGEILTIRHDSLSRESFVPGMIAAVKHVMTIDGLQVGLTVDG